MWAVDAASLRERAWPLSHKEVVNRNVLQRWDMWAVDAASPGESLATVPQGSRQS